MGDGPIALVLDCYSVHRWNSAKEQVLIYVSCQSIILLIRIAAAQGQKRGKTCTC
jgi:hypothetical protein